jgi:hypothetical protein
MCKRLFVIGSAVLALVLTDAVPGRAGSFFGPIYGAPYYREYPQRTRAGRCGCLPWCCAQAPAPATVAPPPAPTPEPVPAPVR